MGTSKIGLLNPFKETSVPRNCVLLLAFLLSISNSVAEASHPVHLKRLQTTRDFTPNDGSENGLPTPFQFSLRRVKREVDTGEDYNEPECLQLPPKPRITMSDVPINLIDLLNNGSHYPGNDNVKDAVLILGNTGCGKTTLTQIVSGDLNKLHAVLTPSGRLVIIDDDNKIGAPSTISKTVVPELAIDENGTAIYDCPGFDDTRGAEQDIAANFFINQIIQKLHGVKLLFLVTHNSVIVGNDRLDFDLLVNHATKFLKNIPKYKNSIGLVVTKVNSYNEGGRYVNDRLIRKEIVHFLKTYLENLRFNLGSSSSSGNGLTDSTVNSRDHLERKIEFVEALLKQNGKQEHSRISFSRSPSECGVLSESSIISETKTMVIKLYSEELEYGLVNPEDFGYTLKDKSKLAILEYVSSLNQYVTEGITVIMDGFKTWFQDEYLQAGDLFEKMKLYENGAEAMDKVLTTWDGSRNLSNPEEFMTILRTHLLEFRYSIPLKDERFIQQQQNYFTFFDDINGATVIRAIHDWPVPVEDLKASIKEDQEEEKIKLREYIKLVHQNVTIEISSFLNDVMEWHSQEYIQATDFDILLHQIRNETNVLTKALFSLNESESGYSPIQFINEFLFPLYQTAGFNVSTSLLNNVQIMQSYFQMNDEMAASTPFEMMKDWELPLSELMKYLHELEMKAQLSLTVQLRDKEITALRAQLEESKNYDELLCGQLDQKDLEIENLHKQLNGSSDDYWAYYRYSRKCDEESQQLREEFESLKGCSVINHPDADLGNGTNNIGIDDKHMKQEITNDISSLLGELNSKITVLKNHTEYKESAFRNQVEAYQRLEKRLIQFIAERNASEIINLNTRDNQIVDLRASLEVLSNELRESRNETGKCVEENNQLRYKLEKMTEEAYNATQHITERIASPVNLNSMHFQDDDGNSELHLAARRTDEQAVQHLVQMGANLNKKNYNFETPLILAAMGEGNRADQLKIIKYLASQGADMATTDTHGETFLHKLFSNMTSLTSLDFLNISEFLIVNNASNLFNVGDSNSSRTPLMLAGKNVEMDSATLRMLRNNAVDFTLVDKDRKSFLSYVVEGGKNEDLLAGLMDLGTIKYTSLEDAIDAMDEEAVKVLVSLGADVNARNPMSLVTPLHMAATSNDTSFAFTISKFLIENTADASAKDVDGYTFLDRWLDDGATLTTKQFHEIVELLMMKNYSQMLSSAGGYQRKLRRPWAHSYRQSTPLHMAVKNIDVETATLTMLQDNGVNFNTVNYDGDSVLSYALMGNRNTKFIFDLVSVGANPLHISKRNSSLLHFAAVYGDVNKLKYLSNFNLDINGINSDGNTPLHLVVSRTDGRTSEMAQLLLTNEANPNITNILGQTPLAIVSRKYPTIETAIDVMDEDGVKILVMFGANVNSSNNRQETALHRVALSNDTGFAVNVINFFIANEANVYARDTDGFTFLDRLVNDGTNLTPNQFHEVARSLLSKNISLLFNTPKNFSNILNVSELPCGNLLSSAFQMGVKNLEIKNETLALLHENGVDFNAVNENGDAALFYTLIGKRSTRLMTDLVERGANVDHLNKNNQSLLHRAAIFGNVDQLQFLLNSGLNFNAVDSLGYTPLHRAVMDGDDDILEKVQLLIDEGANVHIKIGMETALDMVLERDDLIDKDEVVTVLREYSQ